jgi:hypothetical protein
MLTQFPGLAFPRLLKGLLSFILILCGLSAITPVAAQQLTAGAKKELRKHEDSLRTFADQIVYADQPNVRFRSDSQFIRSLVRTLKVKNSFYYPFDSLQTISHIYAPDSSFRIFTWQFRKDEYLYLQEGVIQVNEPDGSLKLYPLFDVSKYTKKPMDSVRGRKNWIGALYYRIILKTYEGSKYYTLLGFDDYSPTSNKKMMEVLTFSPEGEPLFGGPFISFQGDSARKAIQYRFSIEYNKEATTRFNYDPEMDMIVFDHLIPEGDEPAKKDSYIPDGDFEGFKWQNGRWVHVDKIFDFKLKDGDFPTDEKLLDESGNPNEQKLMEQSQKNQQNQQPPQKKDTTPVKKPGGQATSQ